MAFKGQEFANDEALFKLVQVFSNTESNELSKEEALFKRHELANEKG